MNQQPFDQQAFQAQRSAASNLYQQLGSGMQPIQFGAGMPGGFQNTPDSLPPPPRAVTVTDHCNEVMKETEYLAQCLVELAGRIEPVLRSQPPSNVNSAGEQQVQANCAVAENIQVIGTRIRNAASFVRDLINRASV